MLHDILIAASIFFLVFFYGLNSFCQALPQFMQVAALFNFVAEIPGVI